MQTMSLVITLIKTLTLVSNTFLFYCIFHQYALIVYHYPIISQNVFYFHIIIVIIDNTKASSHEHPIRNFLYVIILLLFIHATIN